nr:uncharacterized protein si:dkey-96l17.6 [Syngnathus scovelli]
MYVNSSGADTGSFTLTFLGKKVGRHRSVAPAGKKCAWERNNPCTCPEEPTVFSKLGPVPATTHDLDLPGRVPQFMDESSYQVDQREKNTAGALERK